MGDAGGLARARELLARAGGGAGEHAQAVYLRGRLAECGVGAESSAGGAAAAEAAEGGAGEGQGGAPPGAAAAGPAAALAAYTAALALARKGELAHSPSAPCLAARYTRLAGACLLGMGRVVHGSGRGEAGAREAMAHYEAALQADEELGEAGEALEAVQRELGLREAGGGAAGAWRPPRPPPRGQSTAARPAAQRARRRR